MAVQAYVLFKVSSGSERDVCKKIAELEEVCEADIIFGGIRPNSKSYS